MVFSWSGLYLLKHMMDILPHVEIIFVVLTALLTAGVSYYLGKRKSGREDFDVLITANEQFRVEIRKDLIESKATVTRLETIIAEKEKELELLTTENTNVRNEILEKERKLSEMRIDVLRQQVKIVQLEERIKTLDKR